MIVSVNLMNSREDELLFTVWPSGKPLCIVCENAFSQNRRHGLNKHYKTKHQTEIKEKLKLVLGSELWKEYLTKKKVEIRREQNVQFLQMKL